jgi:hypothetical protein
MRRSLPQAGSFHAETAEIGGAAASAVNARRGRAVWHRLVSGCNVTRFVACFLRARC